MFFAERPILHELFRACYELRCLIAEALFNFTTEDKKEVLDLGRTNSAAVITEFSTGLVSI